MTTKPTATLEWREPSTSGTTTVTTVTANIQRVSYFVGRRNIQDDYQAGTCTVSGRGFLSSEPPLGYYARVYITTGAYKTYFYGFITDYQKSYGITSAYDTFDLKMEGSIGSIGSNTVAANWGANTGWTTAIGYNAVDIRPVQIRFPATTYGSTLISAVNANYLYNDLFQTICATAQNAVWETGDEDWPTGGTYNLSPVIDCIDRNDNQLCGQTKLTVSDNPGVGEEKFTGITFNSSSYNYSTKVTVEPAGLAAQSAGTGIYQTNVDSLDANTSQASDLAKFLKASFDAATTTPSTVSVEGASGSASLIAVCRPSSIKNFIKVKLRGSTYAGCIEGIEFDADPTDWRCTFTLSGYPFIRLGDAQLAVLDTSKLGY